MDPGDGVGDAIIAGLMTSSLRNPRSRKLQRWSLSERVQVISISFFGGFFFFFLEKSRAAVNAKNNARQLKFERLLVRTGEGECRFHDDTYYPLIISRDTWYLMEILDYSHFYCQEPEKGISNPITIWKYCQCLKNRINRNCNSITQLGNANC